jgi:hypothetical protein
MSIGSCFVISHKELFDIVSGYLMFKICLKHLFTKHVVCSCLFLILSMFHRQKGERILH